MRAEEFWKAFISQIEINRTKLEKVWNLAGKAKGETAFTKEIKIVIANAIADGNKIVSESLDVHRDEHHIQTEYYRIDLIDWTQKKDNDFYIVEGGLDNYQLRKHAWNFDIAVEHENDENDWSDEIIKLAYIFCDLRVVIGYFPYIATGKEEMQQKYLNKVAETINGLKCKGNMKHGEFLVILGDIEKGESDGFKMLTYTPYLYRGTRFIKQDW